MNIFICLIQQLIYTISFNINYAAQSKINETIEDETSMSIPNYILENNETKCCENLSNLNTNFILFNELEDTHIINSNVKPLDENYIIECNKKLQTYVIMYYLVHPLQRKKKNILITTLHKMILDNRKKTGAEIKYDNNLLYCLLCNLIEFPKYNEIALNYLPNNIDVSLKLSLISDNNTKHNVKHVDIKTSVSNMSCLFIDNKKINNVEIYIDDKHKKSNIYKRYNLYLIYKNELLKYVQSLDLQQYYTQYNKQYIEDIRTAIIFLAQYNYF